jgi:small subunit ribosomal protein S15Ae
MVRISVLGDALKTMYNAEKRGKRQVLIRPASKVVIKFLQLMQKHGYINEFEYVDDHRAGKIVVELNGRLNKCGVISPRYDISHTQMEDWVARLLPSRLFGVIVLTTSAGIMDHETARSKGVGGKGEPRREGGRRDRARRQPPGCSGRRKPRVAGGSMSAATAAAAAEAAAQKIEKALQWSQRHGAASTRPEGAQQRRRQRHHTSPRHARLPPLPLPTPSARVLLLDCYPDFGAGRQRRCERRRHGCGSSSCSGAGAAVGSVTDGPSVLHCQQHAGGWAANLKVQRPQQSADCSAAAAAAPPPCFSSAAPAGRGGPAPP